jgi:hypothetical protein
MGARDVLTVSAKGQVVIPQSIRIELGHALEFGVAALTSTHYKFCDANSKIREP